MKTVVRLEYAKVLNMISVKLRMRFKRNGRMNPLFVIVTRTPNVIPCLIKHVPSKIVVNHICGGSLGIKTPISFSLPPSCVPFLLVFSTDNPDQTLTKFFHTNLICNKTIGVSNVVLTKRYNFVYSVSHTFYGSFKTVATSLSRVDRQKVYVSNN